MKFALASDLHLTFGPLGIKNTEEANVLVLAGDIYEIADLFPTQPDPYELIPNKKLQWVIDFFQNASAEFKDVIWIAGNHEHYDHYISDAKEVTQKFLDNHGLKNVHFLEKESIKISGVNFHCTTLWTDFHKGDPQQMYQAQRGMNDYKSISLNLKTGFSPEIALELHKESMEFLENVLVPGERNVVVTHHQPTFKSIEGNPRGHVHYISGAYASDLSEFILSHPEIQYWVAGHTHNNCEYYVGDNTIVAVNCRGYSGYEQLANHFKLKYFEV